MKITLLSALLTCLILSSPALHAAPKQPVILGYYPSWRAQYLPSAEVQYKYFNYLTQAFFPTDANGKMGNDAKFDNQQFVDSAHANGTKVLGSCSVFVH